MLLPATASAATERDHTRYTVVAISLHWVSAAAILTALGMGWYMADLPFSLQRVQLVNWHKWLGVTILAVSLVRLMWRVTHRPPGLPAGMPPWQRAASHATHRLLYVLFFAVPLAGWAYSSAAGFPIVFLGVLPLPDFVPKDEGLAELIKPVHGWLAYTLAALVVLHVAAAAKHRFIDRDGLMTRMWPRRA